MDVAGYLDRIGLGEPGPPTLETLRTLQLAHLLSVPFENLSIHDREPIVLEEAALFDKIVRRRRGGFCYELNGLFAGLLCRSGYDVAMVAAEVAEETGGFSPAFDHMALVVTLDRRWLVDVGFGDTFRQPLAIDDSDVQEQLPRGYRIERDANRYLLTERGTDGRWRGQYRFRLRPHELEAFRELCRFHQTSSESHFRRRRLCSKALPDGRVTLSGMRRIATTLQGDRHERILTTREEYRRTLFEDFGVVWPGGRTDPPGTARGDAKR